MCHLLRYSAIQSVYEQTFRRNVSPPSSGSKISRARSQSASRWLDWFYTLKMDVIHSFETFVHIRTTWVYIPADWAFTGKKSSQLNTGIATESGAVCENQEVVLFTFPVGRHVCLQATDIGRCLWHQRAAESWHFRSALFMRSLRVSNCTRLCGRVALPADSHFCFLVLSLPSFNYVSYFLLTLISLLPFVSSVSWSFNFFLDSLFHILTRACSSIFFPY
jgi:hypothetical protein